ncbi:hypothetical protein SAMN05444678_10358 [Sphingomonas sp. YR710]|uniref:hypothetical protein n=1 Tax=Sphingomonas sp. YR710 TaxID=1882773 RepID=UPI000889FE14|nr:hypothetical protein [Sphingomonas sp. YR710]SDC44057.1 hypothetical protein SAMN05444678_10358 [Sphingomonas sp. YR710]
MRQLVALGLLSAMAMLTACHPTLFGSDSRSHSDRSRYTGIGVYSTGELWPKIAADPARPDTAVKDAAAATTDDDEHVIVVVDTKTGEIRECGDYSGKCISMNPWTKAISASGQLPVPLTKHAADLQREREQNQKQVEISAKMK